MYFTLISKNRIQIFAKLKKSFVTQGSFLVCMFFVFPFVTFSQPDSLYIKKIIKHEQKPEWKEKSKVSLDLSEVTFVNWNAGGSNSVSALLGYVYTLNYKDKYIFWNNTGALRYGLNKQQKKELRKTDDLFEITSNLGYKPEGDSDWFYSARFNFKTQLANGFKDNDREQIISRILAPGYLFLGAGMEYGKNIEYLSFYFSPLTLKTTFVLDESLANAGAFGVNPAILDEEGNIISKGQRARTEVGILLTNSYEMEVTENITAKNLLSLYSDYFNNFGNIDLDWRLGVNFKVNNFVRATLESHLKYDDDVKISITNSEDEIEEAGARVQWKQFLGVGFAMEF